MPRQFSFRRIFLGLAAGLLSTPVGLILAYVVGFAGVAFKTRDLFATLLTGFTFLPIMLALVLAIPTLVISTLVGLTIGTIANFTSRFLKLGGALLGVVWAEIVLSGLLPLIVVPQPGDFTSIVSNHFVAGAYGLIMGILTSWTFRLLGN